MHVQIQSPEECSPKELKSFRNLVMQGGEVDPNGLENRIHLAEQLLFGYCEEDLIAVAAIKKPPLTYRKKIFKNAGVIELAKKYEFELGWIFVKEPHRGNRHSTTLTDKAIKFLGNSGCYATTKTKNIRMHQTLEKFGFIETGPPWQSTRGDYCLSLFLR